MGSQGEAILDYSLYDAHKAGFDTAVIIIKEAIRKDFMETVGERLKKCPMEIRYAYQELDDIPAGYTVPEGRTKPWGTCHAVLRAHRRRALCGHQRRRLLRHLRLSGDLRCPLPRAG